MSAIEIYRISDIFCYHFLRLTKPYELHAFSAIIIKSINIINCYAEE